MINLADIFIQSKYNNYIISINTLINFVIDKMAEYTSHVNDKKGFTGLKDNIKYEGGEKLMDDIDGDADYNPDDDMHADEFEEFVADSKV